MMPQRAGHVALDANVSQVDVGLTAMIVGLDDMRPAFATGTARVARMSGI